MFTINFENISDFYKIDTWILKFCKQHQKDRVLEINTNVLFIYVKPSDGKTKKKIRWLINKENIQAIRRWTRLIIVQSSYKIKILSKLRNYDVVVVECEP